MPITNSLKPNLKLMVTMSGISSCGLWLLQGHVSANYSISKQNMYKSGILTYIAREERYAVCISRKLAHGGCEMAQRNRTYFWLHLSESVWTAHYHSWNSFSTQTFCREIRNEQGGCLSSFIPSSFRQKLSGSF